MERRLIGLRALHVTHQSFCSLIGEPIEVPMQTIQFCCFDRRRLPADIRGFEGEEQS